MTFADFIPAEASRFDYAFKVFEKAADYREQLEKFALDKNTSNEEAQRYSHQQAEYWVLRTCLVSGQLHTEYGMADIRHRPGSKTN